jgi:UDP-N-acetylglucosamine--N-acetylmuramyl-(pentapeptide) pyrophosphoryl-undecaprenol N-acetylglucosamine transferase
VKEFEHRMDLAYAAADIVICRSGAGTIAELIRNRKPSLLIPFPFSAGQHQWENARFLAHVVKGARLLDQSKASIEKIREEISCLLEEKDIRKAALDEWNEDPRVSFKDRIFQRLNNG